MKLNSSLGKISMHRGLAADLYRELKTVGWTLQGWWEHYGLKDSMTLAQLRKVLRGELHREDEVYAVEWCVQKFLGDLSQGVLAGPDGLTRLKLPNVDAKLDGNVLTMRLFFAPAEEIDAVREQMKQVVDYLNLKVWQYPTR